MPERRNEPIKSFQEGDVVQGFALVVRREVRQDRSGRDYVDMDLADASGSISAKAWWDSKALQRAFRQHSFVAYRGLVKSYREQLQLVVDDCREATDADRAYGFDEASLVPTSRYDIGELWRRLETLLARQVKRPQLQRLVRETLAQVGAELREHPAAKSIHHAFRGGLLEHVVSMAELADRICDHYPELDRDLMLVGALFHDLGKLRELGAMPANDYTLEGRLVGHVVLGRDLLLERCAAILDFPPDLRLQLEHLILSHQGQRDFGAVVEPMTPEAVALHFIDDLDSKLAQLRMARESGVAVQWHRTLQRYLYFAPPAAGVDVEPVETEPAQVEPAVAPEEGGSEA